MDTNEHERIQNHEWTRMDTNIEVNHERHGKVRVGVARRPARTSNGRWLGGLYSPQPPAPTYAPSDAFQANGELVIKVIVGRQWARFSFLTQVVVSFAGGESTRHASAALGIRVHDALLFHRYIQSSAER